MTTVCSCCEDGKPANCDPGPTPEESFWVMEILAAVADPFDGPRGNIYHPGTSYSVANLVVPIGPDCYPGRGDLLERTFDEITGLFFEPFELHKFTGNVVQSLPHFLADRNFTFRCRDIDTNPNLGEAGGHVSPVFQDGEPIDPTTSGPQAIIPCEGDFTRFGPAGREKTYRLFHESTEILEDGSKKWVYRKPCWLIVPRNFGFDVGGGGGGVGSGPGNIGVYATAEIGIAEARFTIFEKSQPAAEFEFWPYLRGEESGAVVDGDNGLSATVKEFTAQMLPLDATLLQSNTYVNRWIEFTTGELAGIRRRVANYLSAAQRFIVLHTLPAAPAVGDQFKILADEYMHRCFLDFRVGGHLWVFANPGEGQTGYGYHATIAYHSHMHFFRPHEDNRWYAASAESCCEPQINGIVRIRRVDPPEPLVVRKGAPASFGFRDTSTYPFGIDSIEWPDLTPYVAFAEVVDDANNDARLFRVNYPVFPSVGSTINPAGKHVRILGGADAGQTRIVQSYDNGLLMLDEPLSATPEPGLDLKISVARFQIIGGGGTIYRGEIVTWGEFEDQLVTFGLTAEETNLLTPNTIEGKIDDPDAEATASVFRVSLESVEVGHLLVLMDGQLVSHRREIIAFDPLTRIVILNEPLPRIPAHGVAIQVRGTLYRWNVEVGIPGKFLEGDIQYARVIVLPALEE